MASDRDVFGLSGPLHLTYNSIDWGNVHHRRSIAACLVQGVYVLEKDRQENRQGAEALAPHWWQFFNFDLIRQLLDDVDNCIFGAVYEFKPSHFVACNQLTQGTPRYVIAFRGTLTKGEAFSQDLKLDFDFIKNGLHQTSRFEIGMQAVRNIVAAVGPSNVWLAGHSLGAAIAMQAGKNMAKTGILLDAYLFNPPYVSAPIERIKSKKIKHGIRIAGSLITAGLTLAMKAQHQRSPSENQFLALSPWLPHLFVHPADHICSEYIGYFEHRQRMDDMGAGGIEKLATQNSLGGLLMNAITKGESEPLHILPSANLTVNLCKYPDFKRAHGLHQWWSPNLHLQSKLFRFK